MVKKPEEYDWSSYSMTIGLSEEKIVNSKKILNYFKSSSSRILYRAFVESLIKNNLSEEENEVSISS